ncbi:CHAT domain-containing protein [Coleofasciculus sp. E2-BRE-01]|uniref:CHAT domain-containing protein n=1 Tax=Coleofasciculus sp. E2-BRE-01 TaxID=3069524 RepID=UPI004064ABE2
MLPLFPLMGAVGMVFSYTLPTVAAEELEVILQPEFSPIDTPEHLLLEQPLTLQTLSSNLQEQNPTSTSEPSFSQLAQRDIIPNPRFDQPGSIIQEIEVKEAPPIQTPDSTEIQVADIRVTGSTIFDETELNPIIQPLEGSITTLEELRSIANAISELYLLQGYTTSRAVIVEESLSTEIVEIRVIEGSLEEILVEGTQRLDESYVRSRVQLAAGTPLNTGALEDQLRLLRVNPLFVNVEASLRAGIGLGQSILVVRVDEADSFGESVFVDNYSPPPVGSERLGVNLGYHNPTGMGDEISGTYTRTTAGGAESLQFNYTVPVNPMNGTVTLETEFERNEFIGEPFEDEDIQGESQRYEISYRQPLIRTPREEFALSLGFSFKDGQTFTFASPTPFSFGTDEEGSSRTSVFRFGQDYTLRDVSGAWAFRSQFSLGTGFFDATVNDHPIPDSRFLSWLGQVQRVQILHPDNYLVIEADLQLTTDSLLPSEQLVIGGDQSVRGYRQNVRASDNGFRLSIEDRITLERDGTGVATFQLAPFFDAGYVWNVGDNPNSLQDQKFIAGMGLGALWEPLPGLILRLDYALPLVDLNDRRENAQDEGFYFSVNYQLPIRRRYQGIDEVGVRDRDTRTSNSVRETLKTIESQTGQRAVVIYVRAFPDQLQLVLVTPDTPPIPKTIPNINRQKLKQELNKFNHAINNNTSHAYLPSAQTLYKWLIAPLENEIEHLEIDTLIFSMDTGLRLIPLAALHDGQQFLVENYSISLIPSVSLTDFSYVDIKNLPVLAMGASEFVDLPPLPTVPIELEIIAEQIWQGTSFLNEAFTLDNLKNQLGQGDYGIVHLATHAEFQSGNPSNSYIQLWDTKLRLDQLRELGLKDVELLVLSASRTAFGDVNAELGFAGLAVQIGVKSVLGSIWHVDDRGSLALMTEFYRQLRTAPTKAEALRQAQLALLRGQIRIEEGQLRNSGESIPLSPIYGSNNRDFSHPYYWAGFTMIGSPW